MNFSGHIALTNPNRAKPITVKIRRVKSRAVGKPMKMGTMKPLNVSGLLRPSQVSNLGGGIGGMRKASRLK